MHYYREFILRTGQERWHVSLIMSAARYEPQQLTKIQVPVILLHSRYKRLLLVNPHTHYYTVQFIHCRVNSVDMGIKWHNIRPDVVGALKYVTASVISSNRTKIWHHPMSLSLRSVWFSVQPYPQIHEAEITAIINFQRSPLKGLALAFFCFERPD